MTDSTPRDNRQIARAAGTVILAFIFGQLAGLVRNILVARAFGASAGLDAFLAANRVSETLFNLIAGGALGSAFIPIFTMFLAREEKPAAWRLASAVANLVVLIMSALALLAAIFSPLIVRYLLAPGFAADPAQFSLTVSLLRIQLISAVLFGLSGLVMGILNSHQIFLIPALAPSMYQFGLIFGVLVLAPHYGIYGLAYGVVLGSAAHLLIQIPSLLRRRGTYSLTLGWGNAAVGEVIRLMGPRLLGVAVVQLNFWVNTWLASKMISGSVSGIYYGFALMIMAQAAIAQSVATAAMPTFAAQYALGKKDAIRHSLAATLRGVLFLALPASVGLILLRFPIIQLLYQRGSFTPDDTRLVAWALLWYAAGLVGHSVLEILARTFYAMHDTRTPVTVGVVAMGLNVVFSILFSSWFSHLGWLPLGGLALANSLATALEAITLLTLMRRRLDGIHGREVARGFATAVFASLVMGIVLTLWLHWVSSAHLLITALGGVFTGGLVYGLVLVIFRTSEVRSVFSILRNRLKRIG